MSGRTTRRKLLHLVVGRRSDLLAQAASAGLRARDRAVVVTANPLSGRPPFRWVLGSGGPGWTVQGPRGRPVGEEDVESILVRGPVQVDTTGWSPADAAYLQAETQAAVLGWLWSIRRPVVNRHPAALWLRPIQALASWQGPIRAAGLRSADILVTNVEVRRPPLGRSGELVHAPLSSMDRFVVDSRAAWQGLTKVQAHVPLVLSAPAIAPRAAWIVGSRVLWEAHRPRDTDRERSLDDGLVKLGRACQTDILRVTVDLATAPPEVLAIDPHPRLETVDDPARTAIVEAVVDLLVGEP